jgi:hypothetical protein
VEEEDDAERRWQSDRLSMVIKLFTSSWEATLSRDAVDLGVRFDHVKAFVDRLA